MEKINTKNEPLLIELEISNREFETEAAMFNYRAWTLSRYCLNMFALIRFASIDGDTKVLTPADAQDFMFAVEAACEIGDAALTQSIEENDKVLKIAEGKLMDTGILERLGQAIEGKFGRDVVEHLQEIAEQERANAKIGDKDDSELSN